MPSGFQQDQNQLQPALWRVVIDMSNNVYDVFCRGGTGTCHGLVNPYTWDNFAVGDCPTTVDNALRLARGNIRWARIVEELGKHADAQILDVEVNFNDNNNGDDEPTQVAFTVKYDRYGIDLADGENAGILQAEQKFQQYLNDSTSTSSSYDGENINNTDEAVQEAVMRALIEEVTRSVRVFIPVEGTDPLEGSGSQQEVTAYDATDGGNYGDLRSCISVQLIDWFNSN